MDSLLRLLKDHWTPYIVWTLGTRGPLRFGAVRREVSGISPKVLTDRLRRLEAAGLIYRDYEPTIPPRVTYGLTESGRDLAAALDRLHEVACRWQPETRAAGGPG